MSLNLTPREANALKAFIATIRLKGDRIPSMTLITRRAVLAYLEHVKWSPENLASEIAVLERMATRFTDRKTEKTA